MDSRNEDSENALAFKLLLKSV